MSYSVIDVKLINYTHFDYTRQRQKHYSAFSIGADYSVSVICHGCLLESRIPKQEESMLIKKYQSKIACWEGFDLLEKGKQDKAIKQFRKALV